jgi:hypothetical protein
MALFSVGAQKLSNLPNTYCVILLTTTPLSVLRHLMHLLCLKWLMFDSLSGDEYSLVMYTIARNALEMRQHVPSNFHTTPKRHHAVSRHPAVISPHRDDSMFQALSKANGYPDLLIILRLLPIMYSR